MIGSKTVDPETRKRWAIALADSRWAIVMVAGSVALGWFEGDKRDGFRGVASRGIDLIRLGLFFGGGARIACNIGAARRTEPAAASPRVGGRDGTLQQQTTDTVPGASSDVRGGIAPATTTCDETAELLGQLTLLRDAAALTDEEYNATRAELLGLR